MLCGPLDYSALGNRSDICNWNSIKFNANNKCILSLTVQVITNIMHIGHITTQLRHSAIVNKHGGQLWNSTINILNEKCMINRYLEFVNDSNNVYTIKADAGIKKSSAWHTYYKASLEPLPSPPQIGLHSPDPAPLAEPAPLLGSLAACCWHSP